MALECRSAERTIVQSRTRLVPEAMGVRLRLVASRPRNPAGVEFAIQDIKAQPIAGVMVCVRYA